LSRKRGAIVTSSKPTRKQDRIEQEEVYGTISDEEWNKMVEETLRRDKKLLEKLAKI
jgi:hypothetical protein